VSVYNSEKEQGREATPLSVAAQWFLAKPRPRLLFEVGALLVRVAI